MKEVPATDGDGNDNKPSFDGFWKHGALKHSNDAAKPQAPSSSRRFHTLNLHWHTILPEREVFHRIGYTHEEGELRATLRLVTTLESLRVMKPVAAAHQSRSSRSMRALAHP